MAKTSNRYGTVQIAAWAPVALWRQVEAAAAVRGMTVADVVRRALAADTYNDGGQLITAADVTIGEPRRRLSRREDGG